MEVDPIDLLTNYTHFSSESFLQESHENSWSSFSENSPQHLEYLDQNLVEFDPINYNQEDFLTTIAEMNNNSSKPVEKDEEKSTTIFKGIQAELMEEESLTDLLLAAAEAIESQNHPLVSNLIEKLNNLVSPFNQLAWFFIQALNYKALDFYEIELERFQKQSHNSTSAFHMLQQLSPFIKFAHFTANQAILEASEGEEIIHVIDFDIMEGIQWPPLMADLAAKKEVCLLKLTAIVENNEKEQRKIQETGRRLSEFAKSINFPFKFDQIGIEKEDNFEKIMGQNETVIANCSGTLHHISRLGNFVSVVAKLNPKLVVLVEDELFKVSKGQKMSFVEFFFEAFHHFSALSDSLLRCFTGVCENGFKQVMDEFLGVRILESISQFPSHKDVNILWENSFDQLKAYKKIPFSSFNRSQAKYLISLFRGDFWVQHEDCNLSLCWKSRPLCSATIWVPNLKNGPIFDMD